VGDILRWHCRGQFSQAPYRRSVPADEIDTGHMSKKRQATDALAAMLDRSLNPSSHSAPRKGAAMDWNKFATPTEITNNDLLDVIGDVYMRGRGTFPPAGSFS
jgi:hypothetical protein